MKVSRQWMSLAARTPRATLSTASKTWGPQLAVLKGVAGGRASHRNLSYNRPTWPSTTRTRCECESLGLARAYSTKHSRPQPSPESGEPPSFAFAFDIDGVLLHVAKPIPGATEALQYLQHHNIPFILLTNGGGKHESERVADLSSKLGVPLTTDNFVQSHTPFQELTTKLTDKTIFVTGSNADKARTIAENYGFKSVVTPADILAAYPNVWPFDPLMEELYAKTARPLPKPIYQPGTGMKEEDALKVDAMFVFNDPRDWALDIQLIADLLLSRQGYLGTYSSKNGEASLPNGGWQQDGQPTLFFSNADLLWSTGYHLPRFGQGAFQAAVAGVWHRLTGGKHELVRTSIGKPYGSTYRFAERVLNTYRKDVLAQQGHDAGEVGPLGAVYMIGDNPESDIAGANDFRSDDGTEWCSVLVRTGVWSPERGEMLHKPKVIVDDVKAAVKWALEREGWKGQL